MIVRLLFGAVLTVVSLPAYAADWYTGAKAQQPTDDWIVAVDASTDITTQSSYFGDVLVTGAPAGSLSETGLRVRADALGGVYSYYSATDNQTIHGTQEGGAFLVGYEWVSPTTVFSAYLGGDVRNNTLSYSDPSNPVVGTSFGAKGQLEFYTKPTLNTMVAGNASYSSNKTAYFARLRGGYLIGPDLYVGPEFAAEGDAFFNQVRFGAQLTGLRAGPLQFAFAAGILHDAVRGSGAYSTVDARVGF
jgi:hypothetical protein